MKGFSLCSFECFLRQKPLYPKQSFVFTSFLWLFCPWHSNQNNKEYYASCNHSEWKPCLQECTHTTNNDLKKKAVTLLLVISIKKDKDKNVVPVNVRFMKKHVSWTRKTCFDKWQGPVSHAWCHQYSIFVMIQLSQFMFWTSSNSWIRGVSF